MKKIFKYYLSVQQQQIIHLPYGAQILDVQVQDGSVCVWALVDPGVEETVEYTLFAYGTGEEFDSTGLTHLKTVQINPLVFHIFFKQKISLKTLN